MLAQVLSAALRGIDAFPVTVEVDVSFGLPVFAMVGLPDDSAEPDVPARHVSVSMLHIVRVEPAGPTATVPSA